MNDIILEKHWQIDRKSNKIPDFYSLYVLKVMDEYLPDYLFSEYEEKTDLWRVKSKIDPLPITRIYHQKFCYERYHTIETDFTFTETHGINIETVIKKLANQYETILPSKDLDNKLWYPTDLLKFVGDCTSEQYSNYIKYLSKGK